jgi:hypothetical protein
MNTISLAKIFPIGHGMRYGSHSVPTNNVIRLSPERTK